MSQFEIKDNQEQLEPEDTEQLESEDTEQLESEDTEQLESEDTEQLESEDTEQFESEDTEQLEPDDTERFGLENIDDPESIGDTGTQSLMDTEAFEDMQAFKSLEERRQQKKRRKRIKLIVAIVIIVLIVIGIVSCSVFSQFQNKADTSDVATTTVERADFTNTVSASGALEPVSSTNVTPEVDGIIESVNVAQGDVVNTGDVLFTLKNSSLDKAITEAGQQVKAAQNGVDAARVSLDTAYSALDSYKRTYQKEVNAYNQAQDATSSSTAGATASTTTAPSYDDSSFVSAIDSAQVSLDGANLTLQSAQQTYDEAVATAAKRTVSAPCSGSIIAMNAVAGTAVSSGASTGISSTATASPLITIADTSQMTVTIQVNQIDISKVAVGQAATVMFSAVSGLTLDATVQNIANVASNNTTSATGGTGIVSYAVKLLIAKPDTRLKPGMTANVVIKTESLTGVLTVPVAAVQTAEDGSRYLMVQSTDDKGNVTVSDETVTVKTQSSTVAVVEGAGVTEGQVIQLTSAETSASATTSSSVAASVG